MKGKLSSKHKAILKQKASMGRPFSPKDTIFSSSLSPITHVHLPIGKQEACMHTQEIHSFG